MGGQNDGIKQMIVHAQGAIIYSSKLQRFLVEQCVTHGILGVDLIC